jgi:hypothetical protein
MTGLTKINYGLTVGAPYADKFKGLLEDLEAAGVKIDPRQSGGYNYRNIAGTNRLSNHAYGRALDINWTDNARGTKGKIDPTLARTLAQKHGLVWGGDWSNPDPMHFEVAGALGAAGGQHNHSHASTASVPGVPGQPTPNPGAAPMAYSGATPDSVAQARKMAQALMSQGMSGQPVGHWTQALGRVLQAGVGSMWDSQAAQGEKEGKASAQQAMAAALAGGDPNAHVTALMANPWTQGQGEEIAQGLIKQKLGLGADKPAVIQNYEYRNRLTPEQQAVFDQVQRAQQHLNTGTAHVNPRTGQAVPIDSYSPARDKAAGEVEGKEAKTAELGLPQAIADGEAAEKMLTDLENHPALGSSTAWSGWFNDKTGGIPGSPERDFTTRVRQAKGGAFLTAIQKLRGTGQITEREGAAATEAVARMDQALKKEDFLTAMADYRAIIRKGVENARIKAGKAPSAPATPSTVKRPSGVTWEPLD